MSGAPVKHHAALNTKTPFNPIANLFYVGGGGLKYPPLTSSFLKIET